MAMLPLVIVVLAVMVAVRVTMIAKAMIQTTKLRGISSPPLSPSLSLPPPSVCS